MNFGDIAERYGTFSLGFVALIFTAVQIYLAFNKDDYDRKSKKFDVIPSLFAKCTSEQPSDRIFATRYIVAAQKSASISTFNQDFAKDQNFQRALSECANIASNSSATAIPINGITPPPPSAVQTPPNSVSPNTPIAGQSPSVPPNDGPRYWIYVGTYKDGAWLSKYLNITKNFDPQKFNRETDPNKACIKCFPK
jgi:hypothetical protein